MDVLSRIYGDWDADGIVLYGNFISIFEKETYRGRTEKKYLFSGVYVPVFLCDFLSGNSKDYYEILYRSECVLEDVLAAADCDCDSIYGSACRF